MGQQYHVYDFVLIRTDRGPCDIGYIVDIKFPKRDTEVPAMECRRVGRIRDLAKILPADVIKDEVSILLRCFCSELTFFNLHSVMYT